MFERVGAFGAGADGLRCGDWLKLVAPGWSQPSVEKFCCWEWLSEVFPLLEPHVQGAWEFPNEGICECLGLWHGWLVHMVAVELRDAGEVDLDPLYPVDGLSGADLGTCRAQHEVAERCAVQHECECARVSKEGRWVEVLDCGEQGFKFDIFEDPPDVSHLRPLSIERPLRCTCEPPPLLRFPLEGIPYSMLDFRELLDFRLLRDIVLDSDDESPLMSELPSPSSARSSIMDIVLCDHSFTSCVNWLYSFADNGSQQRSMVCPTKRFWILMMPFICRIILLFAISVCNIKIVSQRHY